MLKNNPRGIARCDYSGLMTRYSNLIKQKEYRGTGLVWTGYYVNPKFADQPNEQNLIPLIRLDPVPLPNARPDNQIDAQTTIATSTGAISIDVSGGSNVTLTYEQFNNGSITFTGLLTADIIIYVPNTYNQFFANNLTTGGFTLSMQIIGNAMQSVIVPLVNPQTLLGPQIVNTLNKLQIVYF